MSEVSEPIGCLVSNGHSWNHACKKHDISWAGYVRNIFDIHIYIYMHTTTINAKRGHKFETNQGGWYEKSWIEERKGKMMYYYIITSKIKGIMKI